MKILFLSAFLILFMFSACELEPIDTTTEQADINNLMVPGDFDFKSTAACDLDIYIKTMAGEALANIRVNVAADIGAKRRIIGSFASDNNGHILAKLEVPSYTGTLYLLTDYLGLRPEISASITAGKIAYDYSSEYDMKSATPAASGKIQILADKTVLNLVSGFNSEGVPNDIDMNNAQIKGVLLKNLNASLPCSNPGIQMDPQYLTENNPKDIVLHQDADVWLTFLHENTGNRNIVGYYTYQKDSAPVIRKSIDTIHVVFPNASFAGNGGGLVCGNRIKLGHFKANTAIGWVCISDGYRENTITAGSYIFYSDPALNPESDVNYRKHSVIIYDENSAGYILGFEDHLRSAGREEDFNDGVFLVTLSDPGAVDAQSYPLAATSLRDSDNDNIADQFDNYPTDSKKAFDNFYPACEQFGTLAFDDMWPEKGDYDMNDLILEYQFNQITNNKNEVTEIKAKIVLKAMGSNMHNGFGFSLPVQPGLVSSANGNKLMHGLIDLASNGLEDNPGESVFIVFDDGWNAVPQSVTVGSNFNTEPGTSYVKPDTIKVQLVFSTPQSFSALGTPPYNPFLFVNQERGREIHPAGMAPTSRADRSLFGTGEDDSDPAQSRYYKSAENIPWAISIPGSLYITSESSSITSAYLKFAAWSQSGGMNYADWYLNKAGYLNPRYIFQK